MARTFATLLTWIGRILVLGAPYLLVCSFFFPAGVQFLNPVVCDDGLAIDNVRFGGRFDAGDDRLELVCTSATASVSAARSVLLLSAALVAGGLACFYVAQRLAHPPMRGPTGPTLR
jgi:hypothetical protein